MSRFRSQSACSLWMVVVCVMSVSVAEAEGQEDLKVLGDSYNGVAAIRLLKNYLLDQTRPHFAARKAVIDAIKTPEQFAEKINHPIAVKGFDRDFKAMEWCDTMVLVMPCGRSAHLELGWACGAGKQTAILLSDGEPELMYRTAKNLFSYLGEVVVWADGLGV